MLVRNVNFNLAIIATIFMLDTVKSDHKKYPGMIYVLLWTPMRHEPFIYWKHRRKSFVAMNCEFQNCFIAEHKDYFEDITNFDVILFNTIDMTEEMDLPLVRADNQIYIFVSTESAANFPQKSEVFNNFFNYTWTYKLNSDITYPYLVVRNKLKRSMVIGPGKHVHWIDSAKMKPADKSVINRLQNKTMAAAWFVTNCVVSSRLDFAHELNRQLNKYNLHIDIYGGCGNKECPKDQIDTCLGLIESDYYFYLSLENSFCEDYVTEKLLTALDHYAVPIVLGGADYSRFMPDGIYINGKNYKEEELAKLMYEVINNKEKYYDYFKWHNYYSYHAAHESVETDPLCAFCAFLNDQNNRHQRRAIDNFVKWWNEDLHEPNDTKNYIVSYGFGSPNVQSFLSYRRAKPQEIKLGTTPTVLKEVGQIVNDIFDFYFE